MMNNLNIKQCCATNVSELTTSVVQVQVGRHAVAHLPLKKLMPGRKDARITKANSIKVAATTKYSSRKLVGSGRSAVDEKNFLSPPG